MTMTKPFADDHIGPWSMRPPGCSQHEMWWQVIDLAIDHGMTRELTGAEKTRMEGYRTQMWAAPVMGTGRVADADVAGLKGFLDRAMEWLNRDEHRPAGKHFVLTDGLYLIEEWRGREYASSAHFPNHWMAHRQGDAGQATQAQADAA